MPVVKFFDPTGAATWPITEMMQDEPDTDVSIEYLVWFIFVLLTAVLIYLARGGLPLLRSLAHRPLPSTSSGAGSSSHRALHDEFFVGLSRWRGVGGAPF